ncbi:DUF4139 domain-containing protein [Marinicella gelatinilytica]|uniref:DUF4139 domain-containing protein n=1 Tax=Marinicella gelatinilytica TaxID=2996017 RepID=UPI002260E2BC|nr:DUF4139 domain-containing protein [Marinicella gelatinilytica]MCX7544683.1 DUF4139 domain-containing protein [Marinicella gelatinilytica]
MRLMKGLATATICMVSCVVFTAEDNSLTIYSSTVGYNINQNQHIQAQQIPGFAVVKQQKNMAFQKGRFELVYDDVTAHIDPTTVTFSTPDNPDAAVVLDQNYQYDLVGSDSLLQKYIDKSIAVSFDKGGEPSRISGRLLSTQGGLIIQKDDGSLITLHNWSEISFPQLPGGLLTKPTLVWLLDSNIQKEQLVAISYQTAGMTWWADYILELDREKDCQFDLSAWVSIINQSGKSFDNYGLKLVAGDVNQAANKVQVSGSRYRAPYMESDQSFQEESVFEYHQYTLPRRVDLPQNSTKQIRLFAPQKPIHCEQKLVFDPLNNQRFNTTRPIQDAGYLSYLNQQKTPVAAQIHFKNTQKNNLGMAMPAGRIRVNQVDSDGHLTFIGADQIGHTANNQTVSLTLGNSFDVNGERRQTNIVLGNRQIHESFEIKLTNGKKTAEHVTVKEHLYRWSNWEITEQSHDYNKTDANSIEFNVKVPAEGETILKYTVFYSWPKFND